MDIFSVTASYFLLFVATFLTAFVSVWLYAKKNVTGSDVAIYFFVSFLPFYIALNLSGLFLMIAWFFVSPFVTDRFAKWVYKNEPELDVHGLRRNVTPFQILRNQKSESEKEDDDSSENENASVDEEPTEASETKN